MDSSHATDRRLFFKVEESDDVSGVLLDRLRASFLSPVSRTPQDLFNTLSKDCVEIFGAQAVCVWENNFFTERMLKLAVFPTELDEHISLTVDRSAAFEISPHPVLFL